MSDRPYTILSCGVSLDGYLDAATGGRLVLSNDEDLDRVDAVRASCDAILVGAATVRNDNPRLLIRASSRRAERSARGQSPSPMKVTITTTADLDPGAKFFTLGGSEKLVYCASTAVSRAYDRFADRASVIDAGDPVDLHWMMKDLYARGVQRLMVEGGGTIHTQFLTADLADELHLVVAPFFVGNSAARRFVGDGEFPWNADRRAALVETQAIGDVVLLRYALSQRFTE